MPLLRHGLVLAAVGILSLLSSAACSDSGACKDSECAAGNRCLLFEGRTRCRKTCSSNSEASASCPFGYTCIDPGTGIAPFCAQDTATSSGKPLAARAGQWGARCQANLGLENPGCDGGQGFFCLASSPTDANAYCTRYDCTKDRDCGAGFFCGQVNQTPNTSTARRATIGEVQNVCLRRTYCSPCAVDLDCPAIEGAPQHCVADGNGAGFCAPECTATSSCPTEAHCADVGLAAKVCFPRAAVCLGDGTLCSPCRVDTDCGEDGVCVRGEYTTERSCAKRAPGGNCRSCPDTVSSPKRTIGCAASPTDRLPAGYCVGLYAIAGSLADVGCWTPDR